MDIEIGPTGFTDMSVLLHPITGIYALFNDHVCIYVGASTNVQHRLSQHKSKIERDPEFYFNRIWLKVCSRSELELEEFHAIRDLQPKYNKTNQGPRLVERKTLSELKALLQK